MSDIAKTGAYIAVAAVLVVVTYFTHPKVSTNPSEFSDVGEVFFPDFTKTDEATAMEVFEFDEETGSGKPFRVEYKDNRWTIPSHHNYPADAKDRLAKTAGALIGLTKDAIVSDNPEDHADLGVVDPFESGAASKGWGTRIKLFNKGGNTLADLIVGKDVEDRTDFKYVRLPEEDRVYRAKADNLEPSIKFADWIDTDLLELSSFDIDKIMLKDYNVDLAQGRVLDKGTVDLAKDDKSTWTIAKAEPPIDPDKELDSSKASGISTAISDLKIVGVREKPEGVEPDLTLPAALQAVIQQRLAQKGFYVTPQGLYSNDGEVLVETKDGLVYTLRFGGKFLAQGDEVTAGSEDERAVDDSEGAEDKADDKKDEKKPSEDEDDEKAGVQQNRFLLVSVEFNEDRFPPIPDEEVEAEPAAAVQAEETKPQDDAKEKPDAAKPDKAQTPEKEQSEAAKSKESETPKSKEAAKPADKAEKPKEAEKKDPAAEKAKAEAKKKADEEAKKKAEEEKKKKAEELKRKREEREQKIKEGKEKAAELTARYAQWYYVIPNDAFEKIRLDRSELLKDKEKKEDDEAKPDDGPAIPKPPAVTLPDDEPKESETKPAAKKDAKPKAPAKDAGPAKSTEAKKREPAAKKEPAKKPEPAKDAPAKKEAAKSNAPEKEAAPKPDAASKPTSSENAAQKK